MQASLNIRRTPSAQTSMSLCSVIGCWSRLFSHSGMSTRPKYRPKNSSGPNGTPSSLVSGLPFIRLSRVVVFSTRIRSRSATARLKSPRPLKKPARGSSLRCLRNAIWEAWGPSCRRTCPLLREGLRPAVGSKPCGDRLTEALVLRVHIGAGLAHADDPPNGCRADPEWIQFGPILAAERKLFKVRFANEQLPQSVLNALRSVSPMPATPPVSRRR